MQPALPGQEPTVPLPAVTIITPKGKLFDSQEKAVIGFLVWFVVVAVVVVGLPCYTYIYQ